METDRPYSDDPFDLLTEPGERTPYPRALVRTGDHHPGAKPLWPIDDFAEIVDALESGGAAITHGQLLLVNGDRISAPPSAPGRWDDPSFTPPPPASWRCARRYAGERWSAFVARSARTAREMALGLAAEAGWIADGALNVDLAWVTEDELSLFDLPVFVRNALRHAADEGSFTSDGDQRPWTTDCDRAVRAGAIPGSIYGTAADSMAQIPRDARFVHISGRAKDLDRLRELSSIEFLRVDGGPARVMDTIAALPTLRVLDLIDVRTRTLDALASLRRLEQLEFNESSTVRDVTALADLPRFRALTIGADGIGDLEGLGTITRLRSLSLTGAASSVPSIMPLSALTDLRSLGLACHVRDQSLAPLTFLRRLRRLTVGPHRFPHAQYAIVAGALPDLEGRDRSCFANAATNGGLTCRACNRPGASALLGKPRKILCPRCDVDKVRRYVARWEIAVSAASARAHPGRPTPPR